MQANPIRIPTVSNDTDWDFCFHLSQQTRNPTQCTDELFAACQCRETEEDSMVEKEGVTADCMSFPKQKLAESQRKYDQLIKEKMNIKANKELIRCFILSRIIFGNEHWKCAQALANLAYGYLTLRGLPFQAKKHAESARGTLLTWKRNMTPDKEKKEILGALVVLYYTLGITWLLQNRGKQAYIHLQKADRNMKELKELNNGGIGGSQVSEKDLTIALGRASLAMHRMNLALAYFEKAIGNVIIAKGHGTSDLISLYEEVAQIEQLRKNHEQAIQYLQQAYSICVSSFSEVSPQTAEASALLAKAYAMSGESQHRDAVEIYFIRSISAYQILGSDNYESLTTIEDFCTWLLQNGENHEAYRLLMCTLNSGIYGVCGEKVAETFYNMGSICFAKGELRKAIRLLRKCLMVQILVYGSEHIKSRETKRLLTLLQRPRTGAYLYHPHVIAIQARRRVLSSDPMTLLRDSNYTLSHSNISDSVSLPYSCLQHLGKFIQMEKRSRCRKKEKRMQRQSGMTEGSAWKEWPSAISELKTLRKIANNKDNWLLT